MLPEIRSFIYIINADLGSEVLWQYIESSYKQMKIEVNILT